MQISTAHWGNLPDGTPVNLHTLSHDSGLRLSITDLGATLVSWFAPDRDGHLADILLGHDSPAGYASGQAYMGAIIGRWANRIANARFTLDGHEYHVDANQPPNHLHGGFKGFGLRIWEARHEADALVFTLESPAGDAGFPGTVNVQVTYTFDASGTLTITYEAVTDAATPLNLTNHAYFNLSGVGSSTTIRDHEVEIAADAFLAVDASLIPTGEEHVADTPFDLRTAALLSDRLDVPNAQLAHGGGFDHCYVLRNDAPVTELPESRRVASVYHPASGRELIVSTTERGLQFYTGNELEGVPGKGGVKYSKYDGLCVEAGGFPDQINMEDAETVVLRPNERYKQVTRYAMRVRNDAPRE
jgi:aldose 1-epimerase